MHGVTRVTCGHVAMPDLVHKFETVRVEYDGCYSALLDEFWALCTTKHGGAPVVSGQRAKYHIAIVVGNKEQAAEAERSVRQKEELLGRAVPVPVLSGGVFKAKEEWKMGAT